MCYLLSSHYAAWIFPWLKRGARPMPLSVMLLSFLFCTVNGSMQGFYLGQNVVHDGKMEEWLSTPHVWVGILLFIGGWVINQHSDALLRSLRKEDGSNTYHIPRGGMFEYTSAANYTGEIIEWTGWFILHPSITSLAFALFTMMNLIPRGISYHKWYQQKFDNYPKNRKAVIPFLL